MLCLQFDPVPLNAPSRVAFWRYVFYNDDIGVKSGPRNFQHALPAPHGQYTNFTTDLRVQVSTSYRKNQRKTFHWSNLVFFGYSSVLPNLIQLPESRCFDGENLLISSLHPPTLDTDKPSLTITLYHVTVGNVGSVCFLMPCSGHYQTFRSLLQFSFFILLIASP